ncbi:MAG TPA: sodium:proton antiporter NhaD [Cyclobacteriaceae bacterium]|nr:sodium:proton antiporter NhaD [Cyclobacteriaceae bacterium]
MELYIVIIFIIGYILIALEHPIKINKTASALVTGVLCWTLFAIGFPNESFVGSEHYNAFTDQLANLNLGISETYHRFIKTELSHHLSDISSILFFLMGAMTIVELVDAHQGFRYITDKIKTQDVRKLLWIVCWLAFFLSAILDNLTTAIVMVSLTRKLIIDREQRLFFAGMIIIAANAGGAWSPIGDVTTTMLWIGGQISTGAIIKSTFLPSIVCLLVPLIFLSFRLKGKIETASDVESGEAKPGKSSLIILITGIGALVFVPIFKTITHLPPYMGMLLGLGVLWIVSELINPDMDESEKRKLSAAHALSRIDVSSMLFFMGILLAVGALQSMQTLGHFASWLDASLGDNRVIISLIGVVSAIVDNVPLVAACMGMYSLDVYPMDHMIWEYLAYCAGTGGSLLVIGSAAGVAVMGMEKLDFIWYLRKISFLALLGYVGGAATYLIMNSAN